MDELFKYAAFISYSSKDAAFAQRLHRDLENYRIPASIGEFDLVGDGKKNRIYPVFRDREELAAGELGARIEAALKGSAALIVVCSPCAAASPWVQKEIEFFVSLGRKHRVFAIITDGAPLVDQNGLDATSLSFPSAFRGNALTDRNALHPVAGDARKGKDGFRNAWLKVTAGLIDVNAGVLQDRDKKAQTVRAFMIFTLFISAALFSGYLAAAVQELSWRTQVATTAMTMYRNREPGRAASLAVAGGLNRGVLVGWRANASREAQALLANYRIEEDFGPYKKSEPGRETAYFDAVPTFALSRDGSRFAIGEGDHRLPTVTHLGAAALIGPVQTGDYEISRNGRLLISRGQSAIAYDLNTNSVVNLGRVAEVRLSSDGATLAFAKRVGNSDIRELAILRGGEVTLIGRVSQFELSRDGAVLMTMADGQWTALHLRQTPMHAEPIDIPFWCPHRATISDDNLLFACRGSDGAAAVFDLRARRVLHSESAVSHYRLAANARRLAIAKQYGEKSDDNVVQIVDLDDLGSPVSLTFSSAIFNVDITPNGSTLVVQSEDGGVTIVDLQALNRRTELGAYGAFELSESGNFLALMNLDADEELFVFDMKKRDGVRTVGPFRMKEMSANGNRMLVQWDDEERSVALLDLAWRVGERGSDRSSAWCAANASTLRPLEHRASSASKSAAGLGVVAPFFRGRPRNPCDWRGLAAILPSRESGDAWFEGPRQWLRLQAVRLDFLPDYTCSEGTFGATKETLDRRAVMCRLYDSRPPD